MITCANCKDKASVEYATGPDTKTYYCNKHLPTFLLRPQYRGRVVPVIEAVAPAVEEETPKKKPFKTSTEETTPTEPPAEAEGE